MKTIPTMRMLIASSFFILITQVASALPFSEDIDANADEVKYVGGNLVAIGHAIVIYDNMRIEADRVVVNMESKDIEATGKVIIAERVQYEPDDDLTRDQLVRLEKRMDLIVEERGIATRPTGKQYYKVLVTYNKFVWFGSRVVGNISSGFFEFDNFKTKSDNFYIKAKRAVRMPSGIIDATDITMTTCEYLIDEHDHWSISASVATFTPDEKAKEIGEIDDFRKESDNYYVYLEDMTAYVGSLPVLWLPVFDLTTVHNIPTIGFRFGSNNKWGAYHMLFKKVRIPGTPLYPKLRLDHYSDRGIGTGLSLEYTGKDSFTDVLLYQINDDNPEGDDPRTIDTAAIENNTGNAPMRFDIPVERNVLRFNHWKHLTSRLDFRTSINKMSDHKVMEDFFEELDQDDPQPTTFAELDYQFDNASLNLLMRPRINDFYSVVERLPELNLDIYRQPISDKVYYQGSTTLADMKMNWREYDYDREINSEDSGGDPQDYESTRLDSLHMFYFPTKKGIFNIIPRAGVRLTAYSDSSDTDISSRDLGTMFRVDRLHYGEKRSDVNNVVSYDDKGGSKLRFIGEIGVEVNTKFYKSWQNIKSAYWELDGLRHVSVPYMNYNYTTDPTVSRDELYYFDAVDRIREQHFTRFGIKNRLQTRNGDYGDQEIHNWMEMENYIDYDFDPASNFENLSEFGTVFTFNPSEQISFSSKSLVDIASERNGIKRFTATGSYKFTDQWKVMAGYSYQDEYIERALDSMGSSLTKVVAGNDFERKYNESHSIKSGIMFPLFEKAYGELSMRYDLARNYFISKRLRVIRNLHCWELAIVLEQDDYDNNGRSRDDSEEDGLSIAYTMTLATMPDEPIEPLGGDVKNRRISY